MKFNQKTPANTKSISLNIGVGYESYERKEIAFNKNE